jgi:hypothetical protein
MDKYEQYAHDWREVMYRIGRKETACFEEHCEEYLENLIVTNCRRKIMCWIYSYVISGKKASRIEDLPKENREQMWLTAKDICKGRVDDKKKMIEICKTLYVIEYFINENVK